jgi:hypothetical protein
MPPWPVFNKLSFLKAYFSCFMNYHIHNVCLLICFLALKTLHSFSELWYWLLWIMDHIDNNLPLIFMFLDARFFAYVRVLLYYPGCSLTHGLKESSLSLPNSWNCRQHGLNCYRCKHFTYEHTPLLSILHHLTTCKSF